MAAASPTPLIPLAGSLCKLEFIASEWTGAFTQWERNVEVGQISNEIAVFRPPVGATDVEKLTFRKRVRQYKANKCIAALQSKLPLTGRVANNRKYRVTAAQQVGDFVRLRIYFFRRDKDRTPANFDDGWYIKNPPMLVDDPNGDIVRLGVDENGAPCEMRFREAPLEAIHELCERMTRKVLG